MSDLKKFTSNKLQFSAAPYSLGIEHNGMIYLSGQVPINHKDNSVVLGDISVTSRKVLENIKMILEENAYSLKDIVKVSIYLTDMGDFAELNKVYSEYFNDHKPSRTCVAVAGLPLGVNVEMEVLIRAK